MGIWCYAKLEIIGNHKTNIFNNSDIASIFIQICAFVRQLKKFSMDMKLGDFIIHWWIAALRIFKESLSTNFGLIAVFVKVAFEITKRAQHLHVTHVFMFFEIVQVYMCLAGWRVYEGLLQNELVIKTFQKHLKTSRFVCLKSSLQFMHNVCPFCETSTNRI